MRTTTTAGAQIRTLLDERGWGIRTLARQIADSHQHDSPASREKRIELERRKIHMYMRGTRPSTGMRAAIEDAFGVERGTIVDADDDEEAASPMVADLMRALERFVDARMERVA